MTKANRTTVTILLAAVLGLAAVARADVPSVGDTIWLKHVGNDSYVVPNGDQLAAKDTTDIGLAEHFDVEDADGTNILLKLVSSGQYAWVNTNHQDRIYNNETDTGNIATHFAFTDNLDGTISIYAVGDDDTANYISPGGAAQYLRANTSSTEPFTWGIVGGAIMPPANLSAAALDSVVVLDWDDDGSGTLDYYTVYRSTTSPVTTADPAFTPVNVSGYIDTDVTNGVTYYYAVSATDTNGLETALSNEAFATPMPASTNVVLWQHLDATVPGSVIASEFDFLWFDQTTNFNDTVLEGGQPPTYPSTTLSGSGLQGVQFPGGTNESRLSTQGSADFLDFSSGGNAFTNSGFAVLVAFTVNGITPDKNVLIANDGTGNSGGFGLRFTDNVGEMEAFLGGVRIVKDGASDLRVALGDTMVYGFNFTANSGEMLFWDSKNNSTVTNSAPRAVNFNTGELRMGGWNGSQRLDAMIGELQIFQSRLSAEEFQSRREAMVAKWGAFQASGLIARARDGFVILDWDDYFGGAGQVDFYTVFRSTISPVTPTDLLTTVAISEYVDNSVINGTTYYYQITATDTNSVESLPSAEVSVTPNPPSTNVVLVQQIDATIAASVQTNELGAVTNVVDQSGNANDAVADIGTVLYPSTSLSASGQVGLDFGDDRNTLQLFSQVASADFLDFSLGGAAEGNSGFAVLVAFKADRIPVAAVDDSPRAPVVGSSGTGGGGGFILRFENGDMQALLGSADAIIDKVDGVRVEAGDTIVYGFNYTADTGLMEFWDSKNQTTATLTTTAFGDFATDPLLLGGNGGNNQVFPGMIGEVQIYSSRLIPAEFEARRNALVAKWGTAINRYRVWADSFGVGVVGSELENDDGDELLNLGEYALGGDPTNPMDIGIQPVIQLVGDEVHYIHAVRADDPGLIYQVQTRPDLVDTNGVWVNFGSTPISTNVTGGTFNYVTHSITGYDGTSTLPALTNQTFVRLEFDH